MRLLLSDNVEPCDHAFTSSIISSVGAISQHHYVQLAQHIQGWSLRSQSKFSNYLIGTNSIVLPLAQIVGLFRDKLEPAHKVMISVTATLAYTFSERCQMKVIRRLVETSSNWLLVPINPPSNGVEDNKAVLSYYFLIMRLREPQSECWV